MTNGDSVLPYSPESRAQYRPECIVFDVLESRYTGHYCGESRDYVFVVGEKVLS